MTKRQITFRCWDKVNKEWANLNELSDWGTASFTACIAFGNEEYPFQTFSISNDDRYVIQQFTGLKDKNGKEVYESDIVKDAGLVGVVEWRNSGFYVNTGSPRARTPVHLVQLHPVDGVEVIGNIHENPELLVKNKNDKNR